MASVILPKGRNVYFIKYTDQHGHLQRRSTGQTDKRGAETLRAKLQEDIQLLKNGSPPKYPDVTGKYLGLVKDPGKPLEEAEIAFLGELVRQGSEVKGLHVAECRRILKKVREACGWLTLDDVSKDGFSEYLSAMQEAGKAPRTQNRHHETLRNFLNYCVRRGWLKASPITDVRMAAVGQKGRRRRRRAVSDEEWGRLLAKTSPLRAAVYRVAAFSGFRRKELHKLQKQDCTPSGLNPRWHVRPEVTKNGQGVDLPMQPECAEALLPIWEAAAAPDSPLFRQGQPGAHDSYAVPMNATVRADYRRAKIPPQDGRGRWADFHSLRYSFCRWLSAVHPIQVVQRLMRHSTIKLTADLYLDLGLEDLAAGRWALPPLPVKAAGGGNAGASPAAGEAGEGAAVA